MQRLILSLILMSALAISAGAQMKTLPGNQPENLNSYPKLSVNERNAVPYTPLREADVIYARFIHRTIDTREKKNQVMNWPKNPLSKIVLDRLLAGENSGYGRLKAYSTDTLNHAMTIGELRKLVSSCETIQKYVGPGPYDYIDTTVCTTLDYTSITRWEVYEEWIFDKQQGIFFPRILAVAPLYKPQVQGIELNEIPICWLNWNELRSTLVNQEVFNTKNDAMRLTYEDFFEQRLFSSYITKESNVQDLAIRNMTEFKDDPMGALYESERIKQQLKNWEDDLWEH